jgi:methyl halide transferase
MYNKTPNLDAAYWDDRFGNKDTPWDVGMISTPLKAYLDQLENKAQAILIPGCGNSYEAAYLLQKGFTNITLIDIASTLTAALKEKFSAYSGNQVTIITGDFFDLTGQYDLILEQTFFCALNPGLRVAYIKKMASLLTTGGKLAGVLFNRSFKGGPPFGGTKEEYIHLFRSVFYIDTMEPCYNSIPPRMGTELFFIARKMPGHQKLTK